MNDILLRIRTVFRNSEKSQTEIGKIIGKTPQYVWKLLNDDKANPSDSVIRDICREFNVNEDWLRTGEGETYDHLQTNDIIVRAAELLGRKDPFIESFLEVFSKMSDSAKTIMLDVLEEIAEVYKNKKE